MNDEKKDLDSKFQPLRINKYNQNSGKGSFFKYIVSITIGIAAIISITVGIFLWTRYKSTEEDIEIEDVEQESPSSLFDEDGEKKEIEDQKFKEAPNEEISKENKEQEVTVEDNTSEEELAETATSEESLPSTTGEIIIVQEPQRAYFVVISSNIDGDKAKDYAKLLSQKGLRVHLIYPINNGYFYRVAIFKTNDKKECIDKLRELQTEYGKDLYLFSY